MFEDTLRTTGPNGGIAHAHRRGFPKRTTASAQEGALVQHLRALDRAEEAQAT